MISNWWVINSPGHLFLEKICFLLFLVANIATNYTIIPGFLAQVPTLCWNLEWLWLGRSSECCYNHDIFICLVVLLSPEEFPCSHLSPLALSSFCFLFLNDPWAMGRRCVGYLFHLGLNILYSRVLSCEFVLTIIYCK